MRQACTTVVSTRAADEYRWSARTTRWMAWSSMAATDSYDAS